MKIKYHIDYAGVAGLHILFCLIVFIVFWHHPKGTIFCDYGDGIKNIFTLITYVKEPLSADGILKYNSFCYPYGEYVYYTDNTPLFSIPLRFFCHYIHDISDYTTALYNVFIISNIIICGLLIYHVLRLLFNARLIPFIMAVVLPWANMEILRIVRGHFNLSFTSFIVFAIYLLILWDRHKHDRKKQVWVAAGMCMFTVTTFFAHGYYIAIVTLFISSMLLVYGLYYRKEQMGKFSIGAGVIYVLCSAGITLFTVAATDNYLPLRKENAMGYDNMEQKVRFSALYSHYLFNTFYFPVFKTSITNDAEQAAYMGNIGMYTILGLIIALIFSSSFRQSFQDMQRQFFSNPLFSAIFLGAAVLLFVSFGEVYVTSSLPDSFTFINILNPFFYLHKLTKRVEQFRSLERFVYPFFFGFYIWVSYTLIMVGRVMGQTAKVALATAVIFLGGVEMWDNMSHMKLNVDASNLLDPYSVSRLQLPGIDFSGYQAILPIPYYCAGSEDYQYTFDDDPSWSLYTYQLALAAHLPSMAFKLSRVPPAHNISIVNCIANDDMDALLKEKFTDKPVLIVFNKKLAADGHAACVPQNEIAMPLYWKICRFPQRHSLVPIDSVGDVVFYSWYPKVLQGKSQPFEKAYN